MDLWSTLSVAAALLIAALAVGHVLLTKRDVRSAAGWVGLILLVPLLGTLLYVVFGINLLHRRAARLFGEPARDRLLSGDPEPELPRDLPEARAALARFVGRVTGAAIVPGNTLQAYEGAEAVEVMLGAIAQARQSVALVTYIFDDDSVGQRFVDALGAAASRGVDVRVIIDAAGARYSFRPIAPQLRARGVDVRLFLPPLVPVRFPYMNLRNHRKILAIDADTAFVGGMNIREGHAGVGEVIDDVQFRVSGPVVEELLATFGQDWAFCDGPPLQGPAWTTPHDPRGPVWARAIADGPDHDIDKIPWTIQGALACARTRAWVVTPYFLPNAALVSALATAALRGVDVVVVIPARSNLAVVDWACRARLDELVELGVRVLMAPPPFDHSKLFLVDDDWALIGSTNWDPRSLRLNFESTVEVLGPVVCEQIVPLVQRRVARASPLTLDALRSRSIPTRLRDGLAWLLSPYL